jgi:hypothetical protein
VDEDDGLVFDEDEVGAKVTRAHLSLALTRRRGEFERGGGNESRAGAEMSEPAFQERCSCREFAPCLASQARHESEALDETFAIANRGQERRSFVRRSLFTMEGTFLMG